MLSCTLKSKIHMAKVTGCKKEYVGSITVAKELIEAAGLKEYERVLVADLENGNRFETYVIEGAESVIEVNGAAANLVCEGDRLIIMAFAYTEEGENVTPKIVTVTEDNKIRDLLP